MRIYKIQDECEKFTVIADEIVLQTLYGNPDTDKSLIFYNGKMVVAVFKNWKNFVDLGEYSPLQVSEEPKYNE